MSDLAVFAAVAALLGSGIIAGTFFAFSSFVMKALARMPSPEGIAAMQSINIVVINRSFLGTFFGTAVLSVGFAVVALASWIRPEAPYFLAAAFSYLFGTFGVTMLGNVPLNNRLAAVTPTDTSGGEVWDQYLDRWTLFNTLRTIAAAAAVLMYTLGLIQSGSNL